MCILLIKELKQKWISGPFPQSRNSLLCLRKYIGSSMKMVAPPTLGFCLVFQDWTQFEECCELMCCVKVALCCTLLPPLSSAWCQRAAFCRPPAIAEDIMGSTCSSTAEWNVVSYIEHLWSENKFSSSTKFNTVFLIKSALLASTPKPAYLGKGTSWIIILLVFSMLFCFNSQSCYVPPS